MRFPRRIRPPFSHRPTNKAAAMAITNYSELHASAANWLLTNYPDLYLAATLAEGFGYLMDDEALKWVACYGQTLTEVNAKEARARSMAQLKTDVPLFGRRQSFDINRGW